ncbi:MAG: hypothetical protein V3U02_08765 [Calditrichia bacterium]
MRNLLILALLIVTITILSSGCAAFQSHKKINLAPFAENAVSIVSEVEYGLSQARAVHVRPFLGGPATIEYQEQWNIMGRFLRGIVAYSIQVATISQSDISDKKKAAALSKYMAGLAGPLLEDPELGFKITREEFSTVVENIRNQDDYFKAMNAAQPVVDEVARVAKEVLKDLKDAQDGARLEVARRIEEDHAPVLKYKDELKEGVDRTLQSAVYLARWRSGEKSMEDSLLRQDPALREFLKPGQPMTFEIAGKISNLLRARLEGGKLIQDHLYPEMEQFQKEMQELDNLIAIADRGIRQSKGAIAVWRRSHQTMAAGITEPAAIDLFGIAQAAVRKVAPIP